jgi:hypothetical protein
VLLIVIALSFSFLTHFPKDEYGLWEVLTNMCGGSHMRKSILVAAMMVLGFSQAHAKDNYIRGILGMSQGALNLGADYEKRASGDVGMGGYFFYTGEKKDAAKNQFITIGGNIPVHFVNNKSLDLYLAPGFGIAMIDGLGAGDDDETVLGTSLKAGIEFEVSPTMLAGLQWFYITNWFEDSKPGSISFLNASATFAF